MSKIKEKMVKMNDRVIREKSEKKELLSGNREEAPMSPLAGIPQSLSYPSPDFAKQKGLESQLNDLLIANSISMQIEYLKNPVLMGELIWI